MRLYILIFLFVLNSVSFGLDLSNKLFKSNNILGKSHGGLGNDKDVYVDGVGVQISGLGFVVNFKEYNDIVFKYGEEAKKLDMSLKEYLDSIGLSYKEQFFPNYISSAEEKIANFKNILINKCGITEEDFNNNFNSTNGEYVGNIECSSKSLTNEDLNAFTPLKSIYGNLFLADNNFDNTDGLSNLTYIGGSFHLYNNSSLSNLDGLSHLTSVGGAFDLNNNPSLTNVDGLSNLNAVYSVFNLANNQSLTNVDGLSNLTVVGSSFSLAMNPSLKDISGISNLIDFHIIYLDNENSNNSHYRNSFDIKIDGASDVCNSSAIYYYNSGWVSLPADQHNTVCQ